MKNKPIIIVAGEPNSIFLEILIKCLKSKKFRSPIILIVSLKTFLLQMKYLKTKYDYILQDLNQLNNLKLKKNFLNIINVDYPSSKAFQKISSNSKIYIENCFNLALKIINTGVTNKLINGPISKKYFLEKNYLGVTEYLAKITNTKKFAMLIYNKKLSVCPLTTHLPINLVSKQISKKKIIEKVLLTHNFYKKFFNKKPKIAVTGLNPHCESISSYDEDKEILKPTIQQLKKKINVNGPYSADTIFLRNNRKKYDLIIGMYHDQVLSPMKTLFEYDAINITIGLPFIRVSPDHGPNESMMGKNISNPKSLLKSLEFLDY